jgi:hypothetical protein
MHDDIGLAILTSIPFDLAMVKTCIPKTCRHMLHGHGKRKKEKKNEGKEGKGFTLIHMLGMIISLFGPQPILIIRLVLTSQYNAALSCKGTDNQRIANLWGAHC